MLQPRPHTPPARSPAANAARACKDDVAKFCKKVSDDEAEGSVVACLR